MFFFLFCFSLTDLDIAVRTVYSVHFAAGVVGMRSKEAEVLVK